MLLSVADTPELIEKTRIMFRRYRFFTYCAVKEEMVSQVEKYRPTVIMLRVERITDSLKADVMLLYERYPDIKFVIVSDDRDHGLHCEIQVKASTKPFELLFHALYYMPACPASSAISKENLIVHGLYFNTYHNQIRIFGRIVKDFTPSDGVLLRFLAERYPDHVTAEEIAECCFGYKEVATVGAVAARISRINKRGIQWFNTLKIIKYRHGLGYQIDF
jgi:DNA-binding response OmpR family regulator